MPAVRLDPIAADGLPADVKYILVGIARYNLYVLRLREQDGISFFIHVSCHLIFPFHASFVLLPSQREQLSEPFPSSQQDSAAPGFLCEPAR